MIKAGGIVDQEGFSGGLNTLSDLLQHKPNESPRSKNINFLEDDTLEKRLGVERVNNTVTGVNDYGNGLFDYGVSPSVRKLIGAFGTVIYKMDDLDGTWDSIQTSRTDCVNYLEKISSYLIDTNEAKDIIKYWDGDDATMTTLNTDAPRGKYAFEFNGYCLVLNTTDGERRVYYEPTSTMFTGTWSDYFTLPSASGDEITWGIELRGRFYISLRNIWYRVSYIAGEAVFDYKLTSSTVGAVPRTAKVVSIPNMGEVIMYLGWDRKIRIFDGTNSTPISLKYEQDNNTSEVCLNYVNQTGMKNAHAIIDNENSLYRLFIPISDSGVNNWRLDINYKTLSCSAHTNQEFLSSTTAEDANGKKWNIVSDYNGTSYRLDRGNVDELPINNIVQGADGATIEIDAYVKDGYGTVYNKVHDGGADRAYAEDSSENFTTLGVVVGDLLRNKTDQCQGVITAIANGAGTNARLSAIFTGGTDNNCDDDDIFNVYKSAFLADNDSIYIGSKRKFDTIVIDLKQVGSATVVPTIYYSSDAAGGYTALTSASNSLVDGTTGFTTSGVITFDAPSAWTLTAKDDGANNFNDTTTYYYIRIQRTANALVTTPKVVKINIGNRIDDLYTSPKMFGKRIADIKKPFRIDFYFEPVGNYNLKYYDRIDFQTDWTENSLRPINLKMWNKDDDFLGTYVLGTDLLGSNKTAVKFSVDTQGVNNCYQYYLTSDRSYYRRWKLYKVDLAEAVMGIGNARVNDRVV